MLIDVLQIICTKREHFSPILDADWNVVLVVAAATVEYAVLSLIYN
jgi:hypothetical protein